MNGLMEMIKMKCSIQDCGNEAEYVVNGQSLCEKHWKGDVDDDNSREGKSQGEILAGM